MLDSRPDDEGYAPDACRGFSVTLQSALLAEWQQVTEAADFWRARVLQVGCGYGATTAQIADLHPQCREVVGVDGDERAVQYAFAFAADETLDFRWVPRGMEDPSALDRAWAGRFDWAVAAQGTLFARDHAAALRSLMWCLRPGGRCLLSVPALKPADFHLAAQKVLAAHCWRKCFEPVSEIISDMTEVNCNRLWFHHPHADRVYSALLEQVGYHVLHTKLFNFRYIFSSLQEYKDLLQNLIRIPLRHVPEEKRDLFLKEFQKVAYKKAKKTPGGAVIWNLKYAMVLAKRPEQ